MAYNYSTEREFSLTECIKSATVAEFYSTGCEFTLTGSVATSFKTVANTLIGVAASKGDEQAESKHETLQLPAVCAKSCG